jgi:hypothetical protein
MPIHMPIHTNGPSAGHAVGELYIDKSSGKVWSWTGTSWSTMQNHNGSMPVKNYSPTEPELNKHATLKSAWEDYLIIRKLLGLDA